MVDEPDIFAQRLLAAFLHLSPQQQGAIQTQMEAKGIRGGIKQGVAKLVGIRTPSMLSDMLAGRLRGERYRAQLAELLGVDDAWLLGDDTDPPDWALQPGEAYQRLCRRWRRAFAQRSSGEPTIAPMDAGPTTIDDDEDSNSNRMWTAWLRDEDRRFHGDPADRRLVAGGLGLEPDSREADWLAASRYERVSYDLLLRFHCWLGLPALTHPDVARAGHRAVQIALAHQQWLTATIESRIERYALPQALFEVARTALGEQRQQRIQRGRPTADLEDALELLWRQQLRRKYGLRRPPVPSEFTADTGRTAWSDVRLIQQRVRSGAARGE